MPEAMPALITKHRRDPGGGRSGNAGVRPAARPNSGRDNLLLAERGGTAAQHVVVVGPAYTAAGPHVHRPAADQPGLR